MKFLEQIMELQKDLLNFVKEQPDPYNFKIRSNHMTIYGRKAYKKARWRKKGTRVLIRFTKSYTEQVRKQFGISE